MVDDEVAADEELDDAEVRDVLPDDLDISEFVGPYVFPNNNRRRVPGYLYLLIGTGCLVAWGLTGGDAVLVNDGYLAAGIAMVLIGAYHLVAGWNLDVDERDALVAATERVGFPVGHASAQLRRPRQPSCAAGPRGGSCSTRPRTRPRAEGSCWSTGSTARSWPGSPRTTPRTGPTSTAPWATKQPTRRSRRSGQPPKRE